MAAFAPIALFLIIGAESSPNYARYYRAVASALLIALLGGPRFIYRRFKDRRQGRASQRTVSRRVPVLLVGAGDASEMFIRALNRNPLAAYDVVGMVDEKGGRVGRNIQGVHVLGTIKDVPAIIDGLSQGNKRPQRVIVTKDDLKSDAMRSLINMADELGFSLARLPLLTDFQASVDNGADVKPIAIEDVLGRAQHVLDRASMQTLIKGRRVLVTGAGCLGRVLIDKLVDAGADVLVVDYSADTLASLNGVATMEADITDAEAMDRATEGREIVFHTAALLGGIAAVGVVKERQVVDADQQKCAGGTVAHRILNGVFERVAQAAAIVLAR